MDNIYNLIRQGAVLVIVASGMMVTITSGGIDLAVGSVIGLAGVIVGYTFQRGLSWPGSAGGCFGVQLGWIESRD